MRAGADPNAKTKHGMTALRHADVGRSIVQAEHDAIVELLRGFGAS